MKKLIKFFKDSQDEMTNHVTWMPLQQLTKSTGVVIIGTIVFVVVIAVLDLASENALKGVYKGLESIIK